MIVPSSNLRFRGITRGSFLRRLLGLILLAITVWCFWVYQQISTVASEDDAQPADAIAVFGAAEYSVDAEELDVTALIERFRRLSENAEAFTASIKQRTDEYRRSLDEQYAHMFGDLLGSRSAAAVDDRYAARVA